MSDLHFFAIMCGIYSVYLAAIAHLHEGGARSIRYVAAVVISAISGALTALAVTA